MTPPIGDFSWYPCDIYRVGLDKTFKAVTNCNAWGYLSHFNPKPNEGFRWTDDGVINLIANECELLDTGHSGASFAICIRVMQCIAQKGWEYYYLCTIND